MFEFVMQDWAHDWISVREALRLLLLTALLTLVGIKAFGQNATTRRLFWVCSGAVVVVTPWLIGRATWPLAMANPPDWMIDVALPASAVWVWWTVALLLVVRVAWQTIRARDALGALRIAHDARSKALLADLCRRLNIVEVPKVRVGMLPCSSTLGRPTIALPAGYVAWNENSLRAVLVHELVHIRRRDDRWLLGLRLISCWYWWIPWMRTLHSQYVRAMEESCDDRSASMFACKSDYLQGVVDVVRRLPAARAMPLVQLQGHHLLTRVSRFGFSQPRELEIASLYWAILIVVSGVLLLTSVQPVALPAVAPNQSYRLSVLTGDPAVANKWSTPRVLVHQEDRGLRVPELVFDAKPIYPGTAIDAGVDGDVVVEYAITADGRVVNPRVLSSTSEHAFEAQVLSALRRMRYESAHRLSDRIPAFVQGTGPPGSVEARVMRLYQFRID